MNQMPFIWNKYISTPKKDTISNETEQNINGTIIINEKGIIMSHWWSAEEMEKVRKEISQQEAQEEIFLQERNDDLESQLDVFEYIRDNDLKKVKEYFKYFTFDAINIKDMDGMTPLMFALYLNHKKIIKFLLKHQPNVNIKCKKGRLAFDYYSNHINTENNTVHINIIKQLVTQENLNCDMFKECYQSDYSFNFIDYLLDYDINHLINDTDRMVDLMGYMILYREHLTHEETLILIDKFLNSIKNLDSFATKISRIGHILYTKHSQGGIRNCRLKLSDNNHSGPVSFWLNRIDKILISTIHIYEEELCVICQDEKPDIITIPCHHKVCCKECYDIMKDSTCCLCRTNIIRTINTKK